MKSDVGLNTSSPLSGPSPAPALSRRDFLRQTAATTIGTALCGYWGEARAISPNQKLNIGAVGVAGRAGEDLNQVSSQNIVAICDVDDNNLSGAAKRYPQAKTYNDFRRLMDQKDIEAVVVGTPDHTHAVASVAALQSGRHLYCEKPLTRTVSEARIVTELARKKHLVTQIGTQIHAGSNYRRVVELIQSNVIGPVREVHVWVSAVYGGHDLPRDRPPVPAQLHYDLWLGPVEYISYSPEWVPFKWRNWWAFGGGALADFGCHYMDLPHWALDLSHVLSVEVVDGPPVHPDSTPPWLIVRYQHPARNSQPPVTLTWYHGGKKPSSETLPSDLADKWESGVLFIGTKGQVLADYGRRMLLPEKEFAEFVPPKPFIQDSVGHHNEWIKTIQTGGKTTCSFDYSGPLTETALLGNVAYRVGKRLAWDPKKLRATNCPEAEQYLQHHYRRGWSL